MWEEDTHNWEGETQNWENVVIFAIIIAVSLILIKVLNTDLLLNKTKELPLILHKTT